MIIITGGAGFIGSVLLWELNKKGQSDILIVDRLRQGEKWKNLRGASFKDVIAPEALHAWLEKNSSQKIDVIFHLGATSSTTEKDMDFLMENNVHFSMELFQWASQHKVPFFYASSAATYGGGELGFSDSLEAMYKPVNPYGFSKELFDRWVMKERQKPPVWAGFKFFNVYGPQEYHKNFQASVIYHAYNQIKKDGKIKLFKSYRKEFADGDQQRDFIYVKDVTRVMSSFFDQQAKIPSGIYNLGTGKARSFNDLAKAVFKALNLSPVIEYIDMPSTVINQYQYFTEAPMAKFFSLGLENFTFTSLEDGVQDYVSLYLSGADPYLVHESPAVAKNSPQ